MDDRQRGTVGEERRPLHGGQLAVSTKAELVQAFEDFKAGRLGAIPAGHA
ncbi:hypothetical protein [Nonomuraea candida]|nr:hypothetical protein [Nonomuraea candida]